jgi:hypothetical protein
VESSVRHMRDREALSKDKSLKRDQPGACALRGMGAGMATADGYDQSLVDAWRTVDVAFAVALPSGGSVSEYRPAIYRGGSTMLAGQAHARPNLGKRL